MKNITGKLENSSGAPVHCAVTFKSKSTPTVGGGIVVGNSTLRIKTNPTDGTFEIELAAGKYDVTYFTTPNNTVFEITVPDGIGDAAIETVVSSSLAFVYVAPNTVWNGERAGHLTFLPVATPDFPFVVYHPYAGSHIIAEDYRYAVSYVTQAGETDLSDVNTFSGSGAPDQANRVQLIANVSGVTAIRIWRNKTEGDVVFYLLAEVAPNISVYDDWESHADFAVRADGGIVPQTFNTTAGIIYSNIDSPILYFSTTGLRALANIQFDAGIKIPTGATDGYVLTSDVDGNATWQAASGGSSNVPIAGNGPPNGSTPGYTYTQWDSVPPGIQWWKDGSGNWN